jgi:hypothetical protein
MAGQIASPPALDSAVSIQPSRTLSVSSRHPAKIARLVRVEGTWARAVLTVAEPAPFLNAVNPRAEDPHDRGDHQGRRRSDGQLSV